MAGINANRASQEKEGVVMKRSEAYIGVLIDDLISKGTEEPYRMFTSRAEFRTLLRQDNADLRLTEMSYRLGLASQERMKKVMAKRNGVEAMKNILKEFTIEPLEVQSLLTEKGSAPLTQKQKASQLLLRPNLDLVSLMNTIPALNEPLKSYDHEMVEQTQIQLKYGIYIEKEQDLVKKMAQLEDLLIPDSFDYDRMNSLSNEALQKFKKIKPRTLGQASRISGVNPSDVQILMIFMGR